MNLSRLPGNQEVYETDFSLDRRWIHVWHKKSGTPREVSVHDAATLDLKSRFSPGYGGDLYWTSGGTLFHLWGAGTGVWCYQELDVSGLRLRAGCIGGWSMSPCRRYFASSPCYAAGTEPFRVCDFSLRRILVDERPAGLKSGEEVEWKTGAFLTLRFVDQNEVRRKATWSLSGSR